MLKSIVNLGNVLNKTEQKEINGGQIPCGVNEILVCKFGRCWCQPEIVVELPKDFKDFDH